MKDVSRRADPGTWAATGMLLGCLFWYVAAWAPLFESAGLLPSEVVHPLLYNELGSSTVLLMPPLVGGSVGFLLAHWCNRRAARYITRQLPAGVEEAARECFHAPQLDQGAQSPGGPDERVAPDREGLQGAD
jgi:hypothetical protein